MLGAGEGRGVLGNQAMQRVVQARRDFDVFTRQPKQRRQGLWARM